MKKISSILAAITVCAVLSGCNISEGPNEPSVSTKEGIHTPVAINPSPDKYTFYLKDYVGKNCASLGRAWGNTIFDSTGYGAGRMNLSLISTDGTYIDLKDEETLKKYYVTSQSIEPNTEIKLTFLTDDDGNEYDNLVATQSIEEISLYVSPVQ